MDAIEIVAVFLKGCKTKSNSISQTDHVTLRGVWNCRHCSLLEGRGSGRTSRICRSGGCGAVGRKLGGGWPGQFLPASHQAEEFAQLFHDLDLEWVLGEHGLKT